MFMESYYGTYSDKDHYADKQKMADVKKAVETLELVKLVAQNTKSEPEQILECMKINTLMHIRIALDELAERAHGDFCINVCATK